MEAQTQKSAPTEVGAHEIRITKLNADKAASVDGDGCGSISPRHRSECR
jgi:hypothetical protein